MNRTDIMTNPNKTIVSHAIPSGKDSPPENGPPPCAAHVTARPADPVRDAECAKMKAMLRAWLRRPSRLTPDGVRVDRGEPAPCRYFVLPTGTTAEWRGPPPKLFPAGPVFLAKKSGGAA